MSPRRRTRPRLNSCNLFVWLSLSPYYESGRSKIMDLHDSCVRSACTPPLRYFFSRLFASATSSVPSPAPARADIAPKAKDDGVEWAEARISARTGAAEVPTQFDYDYIQTFYGQHVRGPKSATPLPRRLCSTIAKNPTPLVSDVSFIPLIPHAIAAAAARRIEIRNHLRTYTELATSTPHLASSHSAPCAWLTLISSFRTLISA